MKLIQQIQLIQRTDHLIRRRATGNPEELAQKLQLSTSGVSRLIRIMRALQAPIVYRDSINSYIYTEAVSFQFGFNRELNKEELRMINGGIVHRRHSFFLASFLTKI